MTDLISAFMIMVIISLAFVGITGTIGACSYNFNNSKAFPIMISLGAISAILSAAALMIALILIDK